VAYDDVSHSVYWTDVRQRTINRVALSNHSRHPVINTVYLAPGLYVRLSVCLSVCHNATTTFTPPPADCGRVVAFARGFDFRPFHFHVIILGKLFTHMRFCRQAVEFGSGQGAVMPCVWVGNRRSGIALAMRHRLKWFIHLRAHGLDREMSTRPTLSCGVWPIYLTPDRAAEYCDERVYLSVCIFVCPRSYLRNYVTRPIFTEIFVIVVQCYLWPWLGLPLAA